MLSKMSKRLLSPLLVSLYLLLTSPAAHALEIPLLTWERGKVQNIVVGDASQQKNWTIKLLSEKNFEITFTNSRENSRGFIVYSGELPADMPLGQYSVIVFGDGSSSGTQISQVEVIALKNFNILNSTKDVGLLGISLTFLLAFLTALKAKKHSFIRFFQEDKLNQDGSLLYAKSIPRFAYKYYLYRVNSLKSFKPSLVKFLLEYDDSFLHKLSPLAWVLLPTVGLIAGVHGGLVTGRESLVIPLTSLLLLTVISMIDAYCAIFAIAGFAIAQILLGEVMNIRAVITLAALGLAWVGTSLLSSHLQLLISQEMSHKSRFSNTLPKKIAMVVMASFTSAVFFFLAILLTESVSNNQIAPREFVIFTALLAGLVSAVKYLIHESQDIKIFRSERMESLKDNHHNVDRIISPFWSSLIILATFFGAFVWTQDWIISLLFALLNIIYFGLLLLKFTTHNFRYILKWERSVLIEPLTMALLSYCFFIYIDKLPLQTVDRSMIFILCVYIIAIIHNVLSHVLEITQDSKVSQA